MKLQKREGKTENCSLSFMVDVLHSESMGWRADGKLFQWQPIAGFLTEQNPFFGIM